MKLERLLIFALVMVMPIIAMNRDKVTIVVNFKRSPNPSWQYCVAMYDKSLKRMSYPKGMKPGESLRIEATLPAKDNSMYVIIAPIAAILKLRLSRESFNSIVEKDGTMTRHAEVGPGDHELDFVIIPDATGEQHGDTIIELD